MKTMMILTIVAMSLYALPLSAGEHANATKTVEEKKNPQTVCPVMGGKINPKLYADVKGHRVYVCCKGCLPAVKKHPQKYIDKLKAEGVDVEKIQTTCPVRGGKIDKELYVDAKGKRIYLCCKGCASAVKSNPEKYIEKLEKQGVTVESLDEGSTHDHKH